MAGYQIYGRVYFRPHCLLYLANKSFNSGSLPQDWKCAHVTPIHKKVLEIWFQITDPSV